MFYNVPRAMSMNVILSIMNEEYKYFMRISF